MRIISILLAATALLWTSDAYAATCGEVIDAADEANESWWENDGAAAVKFIDGKTIASSAGLAGALAATETLGKTALVSGGDFSGWDFSALRAFPNGVCFYQSKMDRSKWAGGNYPGVGFIQTVLEGADFNRAKMPGVLLRQADLAKASMIGANLRGGRFDGGWDGNAAELDLSGADMRDFTFDCGITIDDGCALDRSGMKLQGANLQDADISTFPLWDADAYAAAIIRDTIVSPRQIGDLAGAKIEGAVILRGGDARVSLTPAEWAAVSAAVAPSNDTPSFDCTKAASDIEQIICDEYSTELRRLDRKMAQLYPAAKAKSPTVVASQKKWLASRSACIDDLCLIDSYNTRIGVLAGIVGAEPLPKPVREALFIDETVEFNETFRRDPLYTKITPALDGASMAQLVLMRNDNGSYTAWGSVVGANAHTCSLAADGMRFDTKSGWFGVGTGKDFAPVLRVLGDEIDVVDNGHPYDHHPGSDQYVSCGARAYFGTMRRIEVDAAALQRTKEALVTGF